VVLLIYSNIYDANAVLEVKNAKDRWQMLQVNSNSSEAQNCGIDIMTAQGSVDSMTTTQAVVFRHQTRSALHIHDLIVVLKGSMHTGCLAYLFPFW
jgi:hypothetical protein